MTKASDELWRLKRERDDLQAEVDRLTLFMYLLGKAATAHFNGDRDKLLHHVITVAAVALNWHRNATGVSTLMRPGVAP